MSTAKSALWKKVATGRLISKAPENDPHWPNSLHDEQLEDISRLLCELVAHMENLEKQLQVLHNTVAKSKK